MTNRPSFNDFVGQDHLRDNLKVMVGAAKYRSQPAPHMLFMGPPGLGKTSLASLIAAEMGTQMIPTLGTMLKKPSDIAAILMTLNEGDVLFIDEIHAVPRSVYETLYTAVEDFHLDILVGKNPARPVRIELPHFTLVGATTHPAGISGPMRDRFGFTGKLTFYSLQELAQILRLAAMSDTTKITDDAALILARAGRGTPRVALRLYERARDIVQSQGSIEVLGTDAITALSLSGVDSLGLDETDRAVLNLLAVTTGPVGLSTLAATLGEEESTVKDMVEPFLLRLGLISRTSQGRLITQEGIDHLKKRRGPTI